MIEWDVNYWAGAGKCRRRNGDRCDLLQPGVRRPHLDGHDRQGTGRHQSQQQTAALYRDRRASTVQATLLSARSDQPGRRGHSGRRRIDWAADMGWLGVARDQ